MRDYRYVLAKQPHLRPCNINGVSDRLLQRTGGEIFIAYNSFSGCYELHSVLNYDEERNSCNAVIPKEWLNWRIIEDYLANNHKRFGQELKDSREQHNNFLDLQEERNQFAMTTGRLDVVKRTLGRSI